MQNPYRDPTSGSSSIPEGSDDKDMLVVEVWKNN